MALSPWNCLALRVQDLATSCLVVSCGRLDCAAPRLSNSSTAWHSIFTLWWTNIAMENDHLSWIFPLKMVIFHCYVSSPEGISKPTPSASLGNPQQPALWFQEHTSAFFKFQSTSKIYQNIKDICLILAAIRLAQFGCVWKYLEIEP